MNDDPNIMPADQAPPAADAGLQALAQALRVCFRLLVVIMIGAILLFIWKSFFVVEQHEVGLVLRFGRLVGATPEEQILHDGLHFTFPYPIDEKIRVPVKRVQTVESDALWYHETSQPGQPEVIPDTLKPGVDGYTLTGDMSILHSKWVLRYTINSPIRYAFAVAEKDNRMTNTRHLIETLLNSAVTCACAGLPLDEAWGNRDHFRTLVEQRVRRQVEALGLGIDVQITPQDIVPPRQVRQAFLAVTQANNDKAQIVQKAQAYQNKVVSQARADAVQLVATARGESQEKLAKVDADARNFKSLLKEYRANPGFLKRRLYEDTVRRVLDNADDKFVLKGGPGRELRLQLNPEPSLPQRNQGKSDAR